MSSNKTAPVSYNNKMKRLVLSLSALLLAFSSQDWPATEEAKKALETLSKKVEGDDVHKKALGYVAHVCKSSEAQFERANVFLETYAKKMKELLIEHEPKVLYAVSFEKTKDFEKYASKLGGPASAAGFYNPSTNTLVSNLSAGLGNIAHEMTHALQFNDGWKASPNHWFMEGIGAFLENCLRTPKGEFIGLGYSHFRLAGLQKEGLSPLAKFMKSYSGLKSYSQGRWILTYLNYKGVLKKFYEEFRDSVKEDKSGIKALEKVTGKTIEEFEVEWKKWVEGMESEISKFTTKPYPALGVIGKRTDNGLQIYAVSKFSNADGVLNEGDVLIEANGKSIKNMEDLVKVYMTMKLGDEITIKFLRNGKEETKTIKLTYHIDG